MTFVVPLLQALLCEAEADALPKVTGRRTDAFHLTCQGLNGMQKKIKSEDPLRSTDLGMHSYYLETVSKCFLISNLISAGLVHDLKKALVTEVHPNSTSLVEPQYTPVSHRTTMRSKHIVCTVRNGS